MALIPCPDCGREISDAAPSCLGCGRPMHSLAPATPIVIEQTSKTWKKGMLWGVAITIVGFLLFGLLPEADAVVAGVVFLGGVVTFLGAAIGAWWNHS